MFLLMFAFTREREREGENILGKRTDIENQSFEAHFIANKKGKEKGFQHLHDLYFLYTNGWGGQGKNGSIVVLKEYKMHPSLYQSQPVRSFVAVVVAVIHYQLHQMIAQQTAARLCKSENEKRRNHCRDKNTNNNNNMKKMEQGMDSVSLTYPIVRDL